MNRAVFLDRDGTLIEEKGYLHRIEDIRVFACVGEALKRIQDAGFALFMITNQSGVGRGYFSTTDVERVHEFLTAELSRYGVQFQKIYVAPEAPDQPSRGRKPSPEFLFDARDEFGIELSRSYVVGDKWIDLECGRNAGVRKSILVRTGYGRDLEREKANELQQAVIVDDLTAAADWILTDAR